jgi:hypothetical protein
VAEEVLMSINIKKDVLLLVMAFLFVSGCETDDTPTITDKPSKKAALKGKVNQDTLRIVFYDFDRTIPVIHIFHQTGGADDVSNKSDQFFVDAFGGKERINRLKRHFVRLTQTGVKCSIVSDGYTAVIKESLERVDLIDFFEADAIYGNDSEVKRRFRGAKHEVISEEMRLRHISYEEAIFVDDDQENIKACAEAKTCRTLHVHEEDGLTEENMIFLEAGLTKK